MSQAITSRTEGQSVLLLLQLTAPCLLWVYGGHHGCCWQTSQKLGRQHGLLLVTQVLSGHCNQASSALCTSRYLLESAATSTMSA